MREYSKDSFVEGILEPFFDGMVFCSVNKRKPLLLRLIAIFLSVLIFGGVMALILGMGMYLFGRVAIIGAVFFVVDFIILALVINKYGKAYKLCM